MYFQRYSIQQKLPSGRNGAMRWETKVSRYVHSDTATETVDGIRNQAAQWIRYYRFMCQIWGSRYQQFRLVAENPSFSEAIIGPCRNDAPIMTPTVKDVLRSQVT